MQRLILFFFCGLYSLQIGLGQGVSISIDSAAPHASAILDISSRTQGVLFPRMSEGERLAIADPAVGLMVWDTTYNGIWGFDGVQWNELSSKWARIGDDIYNRNTENVGIGITNPHFKLALNGIFALYQGDRFVGSMRGYHDDLVLNAKLGTIFYESNPEDLILQYDFDDLLSFSGNVGIGVGNPRAKLHVASNVMIGEGDPANDYALSVNGRIMATEMRIESYGAWPDYVFEPDYALKSLDDLSAQIASAGHLPGIPSANEIQTNGLMVGDMQKRQMEKIEELTLYILQLHERISHLEMLILENNTQSHAPLSSFQCDK